ncbi:MAG: hypothetical protein N3F03_01560 [Ignavibacteria bacterium]|nr:hypothetical protein [Ignavibacteria bacterium]
MKPYSTDWQKKFEELPAKKVARDYSELKALILSRLHNNYYNEEKINQIVADKILGDITKFFRK